MKSMACRALLSLLLPSLPSPALAVRGVHHEAPAASSKQVVPVPVVVEEVVPVPVIEVVVVGDDEAEPGPGTAGSAPSLDDACERGLLALKTNATRLARAQACEKDAGYTEQAVKALQHANRSAALAAVEGAYHNCMNLSKDCAGQIAPHLVTKMRFSGMTITEECVAVAGEVAPDTSAAAQACQQNMTNAMVAELKQQDMDGVMTAAQHGLHTCHHIKTPCDFQLAPSLVMQLLQMMMGQAQQQMSEVLLAGVRQAEQLSAQMEEDQEEDQEEDEEEDQEEEKVSAPPRNESSLRMKAQRGEPAKPALPKQQAKRDGPKLAAQKKHAAARRLSLLSVDERVHLSLQRRAVRL